MKTIILDIETTGDNHLIDEICQMSYIILDDKFEIVSNKNFFFKVDYVHFKSRKRKLDIEELKKLSNNKSFKDNYNEIFNDLNDSLIVCHNAKHDLEFIKSEFMRSNNSKQFIYQEFCTMEHYTDILKIPSDSFGYKYPKLIEIMPYLNIKRGDIYNKSKELFDIDDCDLDFHDSRVDVVAAYLIAINTNVLLDKVKALCNKRVMPNGDIYEGKIVDRVGIGVGKWTFSGNVYEGDFFDWLPNGVGQFFFEEGSHYVGRVVKGKMKGSGRYTFKSGTVYEGEFLDDKFNGAGRLIWPDGTIFEGSFLNDKKHGYGKLIRNGEVIEEGIWDKGILQEDYKEEVNVYKEESLNSNHTMDSIAISEVEEANVSILNRKIDDESYKNNNQVSKKRSFITNIFSFKGTINRGQYISYKILLLILGAASVFMWGGIYAYTDMTDETLDIAIGLTMMILTYINITLIIRRLHDTNKSAWWILATFIPLVNLFIVFMLIFEEGTEEGRYKYSIEGNKKSKLILSKKHILITIVILCGVIFCMKNNNENKAIDIVKSGVCLQDEYDIDFNSVEEYMDYMVEEKDPYIVYGWSVIEREGSRYTVVFEFDEDNDSLNGYESYGYIADIDTEEIWSYNYQD